MFHNWNSLVRRVLCVSDHTVKALLPGPDPRGLEALLSAESRVIVCMQGVLCVFVGVIVCLWLFMCGLCIVCMW